jgi:hypothetical protein
MKTLATRLAILGLCLMTAVACGVTEFNTEPLALISKALTTAGTIPAGLPRRVMVGLFENTGKTWMKDSGVPWDARYRYFTKGWVNNWGYGPYDGSWGLHFLRESDAQGYLPVVQYHQMNGEPGGGEAEFLLKAQNATTMASYFRDFKIFMERVKEFDKPVLILLEADGYAFLERQSGENPHAYAAVAATGMPELAALPDTVAGWGLAFLRLRDTVGASKAILGIHVSAWASGKSIPYVSVTDPLQLDVDKVYNFLAPLGLEPNVTGATYDVLVTDPLDRDAGYYQLVRGLERWWDTCDDASIYSKSFNRYLEWLRLWNLKANRRWILWQIPLGNSNHLDVHNNGGAREGYKDNRAEYFFANGTAHVARFAQSGVIALLFGMGDSGQSSYMNDDYTDGQLFMKSRVAAFYQAGGVPLDGSDSAALTDGGCPTDGNPEPRPGPRYHFEQDAQDWRSSSVLVTSLGSSDAQAQEGTRSLAVGLGGSVTGTATVALSSPTTAILTPAGATVTFHLWIPLGSTLSWVQPFVQQGEAGGWAFTGNWKSLGSLSLGAWNTLTVKVPENAVTPLNKLGVQYNATVPWTGMVYIDSVSW